MHAYVQHHLLACMRLNPCWAVAEQEHQVQRPRQQLPAALLCAHGLQAETAGTATSTAADWAACLWQEYAAARGNEQEAAYNRACACHHLGLLHLAIPLYQRALACPAPQPASGLHALAPAAVLSAATHAGLRLAVRPWRWLLTALSEPRPVYAHLPNLLSCCLQSAATLRGRSLWACGMCCPCHKASCHAHAGRMAAWAHPAALPA